jgi:hypothetical protein
MSPRERAIEIASDARCVCVEHHTDGPCVPCIEAAIRSAEEAAYERAAQEAESILNDEPGKVIVEIPRLIRALGVLP